MAQSNFINFLDDIGNEKSGFTKGQAGAYGSLTKKLFTVFGEKVVEDLVSNLQKNKSNASGQLESSIRFDIEEGGIITFNLRMLDYYQYVDKGRRPGKFPPLKPIMSWIGYKGLNPSKVYAKAPLKGGLKPKALSDIATIKSLAFLIGRKIAREGTRATNFYSDVINENTLDQFIQVLKKVSRRDVLIEISRK
jgi:hypothetical protein